MATTLQFSKKQLAAMAQRAVEIRAAGKIPLAPNHPAVIMQIDHRYLVNGKLFTRAELDEFLNTHESVTGRAFIILEDEE